MTRAEQLGAIDDEPMPPVGAIVASFPGPIRLYVRRRRKLALFAISSVGAVMLAVALVRTPLDWPTTIFAVSMTMLFGWLAIAYAMLLRRPAWWYLLLDADGFETSSPLFLRSRVHWRDVSEFRVRYIPGTSYVYNGREVATFKVRGASFLRWGPRWFPDSYGLSEEDLTWLMNEWRARALARLAEQEH
jgi:hypothetical protein